MDISDILKVIAIAASPVSELRGAIPFAISAYDFPWYYAFLFGVIGNLLPVPFIILFLYYIVPILSKVSAIDRLAQRFFARMRRRGKMVERYERIGLALFVAIPLPVTGAWTGSVLAVLFGLKFRNAFLSILVGVLVAGTVVTLATLLGWSIAGLIEPEVN